MSLKYNHKNKNHRLWLSGRLLSILPKWGFDIDEDCDSKSWEFVLSCWDKYDITKQIKIFTSIDKTSGMMRPCGKDAIRVICLRTYNNDGIHCIFKKKINRSGTLDNIINRVLEAVKTAQKVRKYERNR